MVDIIIVGGGCAGMTAAIYSARAGKSVMLFEAENFGGQIAYSPKIENFPSVKQISGSEFSDNLFEQMSFLGVDVKFERVLKIEDCGTLKKVVGEDGEYESRAVIIASGMKRRKLGLAREDELLGKGVSYCAVCDGVFYKNKTVAVVGGGNTAFSDAMHLSQYCAKVLLIHRRDEFRGEAHILEALKKRGNVEFVLSHTVEELIGDDELYAVALKNLKTGQRTERELQGLFVSVGFIPQNAIFENVIGLDEGGFADSGETCTTKTAGIFVAGDCRTKKVRQLTTAASDGAVAAIAACEYVDSI